MKEDLKTNKKHIAGVAAVAAAVALFAVLPVIIKYNGSLYLTGDYMTQIIPFIKESRRLVLSGGATWSANSFLGSDFFGTYSYYTLCDPFFYPLVLLPERLIAQGLTAVFIIKHSLAAVFSYLYLSKYVKNKYYSFAGALIYTFSSFTFDSTYYYIFLNTVFLFPLLLYFCDRCLERKSAVMFALVVTANAATNYYLFVGTSVFFVIYLFFKVRYNENISWKNAAESIAFYAAGSICAAMVLLPSALTLLNTGKATGSFSDFFIRGLACIPQSLKIMKAIVLPSEGIIGSANGFIYSTFNSNAAFLPLFGAFYLITSLFIKEKEWHFKLLKFLFVLSLVPFGNSFFSLFSNPNYTRWWYAFVLMAVVCSLTILERTAIDSTLYRSEMKKSVKFIAVSSAICMGLPLIAKLLFSGDAFVGLIKAKLPAKAVAALDNSGFTQKFNYDNIRYALVFVFLCLITYFVLFVMIKNRAVFKPKVLVSVVAAVCALSYCVYLANECNVFSKEPDKSVSPVSTESFSEDIDYSCRVDIKNGFHNMGMIVNKPTINTFNSFKSKATCSFCELIGIETDSFAKRKFDTKAIQAVLSIKYTYDSELLPEECEYYVPFGYEYNYCIESDSDATAPSSSKKENNKRIQNMCAACYIDKNTAQKLSDILTPFEGENYDWKEAVKQARKTACSDVHICQNSVTAVTNGDKTRLHYFSIPHEKGWKAFVNGKPAEIYTINGGMMGIVAGPGQSEIKLVYETPGLKAGFEISAAALVVLSVYGLSDVCRKKRAEKRGNEKGEHSEQTQ